jgi:thiamine biosynthesis protein ThiS
MSIVVNGDLLEVQPASTITDLVATLRLSSSILIEHNGTALRQDEWSASKIGEADQIEIIRIVAGG